MEVKRIPSTSGLSVLDLLTYDREAAERIRDALHAPVAERDRADLERRLERLSEA